MFSLRSKLLLGYGGLLFLLALTPFVSRNLAFVLAAVGVAYSIFVLLFLGRTIIRPLRELIASAQRIQAGETAPIVQATSHDEVGRLAREFNAMAATLQGFRRHDEARLLRTRETTRTAINSLPHAVAVLSPEGQIELANESAERLFGMKPGIFVRDLPLKWLHPLVDAAVERMTPVQPKGFQSAVQVFDKTRELFFLPHLIPLLDAQRQLVGMTVVLADTTELHQIDEAKSGLIASVSHELKTPLTSIQMSIHLLLDDPALHLTPRQIELLQAARDDADRLHELIGSLLDAGRRQTSEE